MSPNQSHSSSRAKALAYLITFAFIAVAVIGSGWIVMPAYGATAAINDPYDLSAAPHIRDVAYTLEAPTYLQRFDSVGAWKVSAGAPTVSCTDSTLIIGTKSASLAQISLYTSDAKGTNITGSEYLEFKVKTTSSSTGITLSNAAGYNASIVFSSTNGVSATYKDASGTLVFNSAFYSSAVPGTYYRVGFTLTASTVSFFLDSANGTALANFIATAPLHAGKLNRIDVWHSGSVSTTTLDWFYAAANNPSVVQQISSDSVAAMSPDASQSNSNVGVDPSTLDIVRSGSSMADQAYNITPPKSSSDIKNLNDFTELYGATPEPMQRIAGKQFAQGWSNFGSSLETALIAQIAADTGSPVSSIHLIDYYVDYVQLKTSIEPTIASHENDIYNAAIGEAFNALDIKPTSATSSGSGLAMSIIPPYAYGKMDLIKDFSTFIQHSPPGTIVTAVCALVSGVMSNSPSALIDKAGTTVTKTVNDTMKAIMAAIQPYLNAGMNTTNAIFAWMNSTTTNFMNKLDSQTAAMMSWSTSSMNQLTNSTNNALQQVSNLNQQFMTWSGQQMAATNAMFSQIFGRMSDQANATAQYFNGQLDKSNEALTNVTNSLNGLWANVLSGGKPTASTPLTLSGIFGTGLLGNTTFVIVLVAIVIIAAVCLIVFLRGGQGNRRNRGRRR